MPNTSEITASLSASDLERATRIGNNLVRDFRAIIIDRARQIGNIPPINKDAETTKKYVTTQVMGQLKHVFRDKDLDEVTKTMTDTVSASVDALYREFSPK